MRVYTGSIHVTASTAFDAKVVEVRLQRAEDLKDLEGDVNSEQRIA